jgi:hypothetical protein
MGGTWEHKKKLNMITFKTIKLQAFKNYKIKFVRKK